MPGKTKVVGRDYPEKKLRYFKSMNENLDKFSKILVVRCDNVRSMQMHNVRIALRGKAEIVMGKNTLQKKVFEKRYENDPSARNKALYTAFVKSNLLTENVGLVLTNAEIDQITAVLGEHKVQAAARVGALAPVEVMIPAGNTGLEPMQTSFFQALNIPTKVAKGTVEILKDQVILKVGDRVGSSEAALLSKLKILPFKYGLEPTHVYMDGTVIGIDLLKITPEEIGSKVQNGVDNLTALSLALGWTTEASLPHVVANAFLNAFSISLGTNYDMDGDLKEMKKAIKEGKVVAAPAQSGPSKPQKEKEEKVEAKPAAPAPAAADDDEEPTEFDSLFE